MEKDAAVEKANNMQIALGRERIMWQKREEVRSNDTGHQSWYSNSNFEILFKIFDATGIHTWKQSLHYVET